MYWFCHTLTWIHHGCACVPRLEHPLTPPSPSHPSGSSQCTSPEHPVSCIVPELAIRFTYDNLHVSMPFSHIILPSPSPTESKRLFNTSVSFCVCVSLLLSQTGLLYNKRSNVRKPLAFCSSRMLPICFPYWSSDDRCKIQMWSFCPPLLFGGSPLYSKWITCTFLQIGHCAKSSTGIIFFHPHGYPNGKISICPSCCRWGRIRLWEVGSLPKATGLDSGRVRISVSAHLTSHSGRPWHGAQHLLCGYLLLILCDSHSVKAPPQMPVSPVHAPAFGSPLDSVAGAAGSSSFELLLTKHASHLITDARFIFVGFKKRMSLSSLLLFSH